MYTHTQYVNTCHVLLSTYTAFNNYCNRTCSKHILVSQLYLYSANSVHQCFDIFAVCECITGCKASQIQYSTICKYLTCTQKLLSSQLSLGMTPKTKNKLNKKLEH